MAQPLGRLPAAAVTLAAQLILTGALHEDGLADTADALGGATTRERIFVILKDSRVGSYGALALSASLLLRTVLLAAVGGGVAGVGLIASHCLARLSPVYLLYALPYVTDPSVAKSGLLRRTAGAQVAVAVAGSVAVLVLLVRAGLLAPSTASWSLAATALSALILRSWFLARAGGVTGDFLGAAEQVAEVTTLMIVVAAAHAM
jgi:adenosylcobinamide-GDP ribazoletransferase